jgi:hypothetical protein
MKRILQKVVSVRIGVAAMGLAMGMFSTSVVAQPTQVGQIGLYQNEYYYDVGGEFTALTLPSAVSPYAPAALDTFSINGQSYTGFQTFCVQTGVDFTPGTIYNYTYSLSSIGNPDNFALSEGAAWLYSQFAQGTLANYDFANTGTGTSTSSPGLGATRTTDAGALQAAIWYLQGGQTYSGYPNGGAGNLYYNEAVAALGASAVDAPATLSTDSGVEILNITTGGQAAQNQLIYFGSGSGNTPPTAPDSGTTLALLALSLAGLAAFAHKTRALATA